MLTSITPLGERGRGQRWWLTATALSIGHLLGGAALGTVLAVLGAGIRALAGPLDASVQLVVIGLVAGVGAGFDLAGRSLPGRRQVDETWLTTYRGWVYGLGFGVQLGLGVVTVVNTALFVAVLVAGVVVAPAGALGIGVGYGTVRGVMAIANARVRTIEDLKRLHRRLDRVDGRVRVGGASAVGLVAAVAVAAGAALA